MFLWKKELSEGLIFKLYQFLLYIEEHFLQKLQKFFRIIMESRAFKGKVIQEIKQAAKLTRIKITLHLFRSAN